MKLRFWPAALIAGALSLASPAAAQNAICPTMPAGDSSNACASTAFVNSGGAPGTDANIAHFVSANYTVQASDCGATVLAGGSAFFTLTLPASVIGFPTNCTVAAINSDIGRGKALSGFPSDLNSILWPGQGLQVKLEGGFWKTSVNPGRWKTVSAPTFFIDGTNGNDANDGLAAGSGAFQTLNAFNNVVTAELDTYGQIVTLSFASGQSWSNLTLQANIVGGGTINLVGNGDTVTGNINGSGALRIFVNPAGGTAYANVGVAVQGFTVTCSGGSHGLYVLAGYVQLFQNMAFGSCPSGGQIVADSMLARIILGANYSITGGAGWHLVAIAGLIDWNSGSFTATLTGTPAYTNAFAFSEIGGNLISLNVWSGAATGQRYVANTGGSIYTNFSGPNFFPGSVAGSSNGGSYDGIFGDPWTAFTPSPSCGTATFTVNSARARIEGKTTWIEADVTITAIGTCTSAIAMTLPNTANSAAMLAVQDIGVNGNVGGCRTTAASAILNCTQHTVANYVVNQRLVIGGVYENQ